ncbi:uncharacterized protein LOC118188024 isoform X2 [Stegodyphus dumicola]|uniref:uncharacterized protein LOC118188024 isoform X2 n=1 Tax=Stegodyphus dumicola TaxID=202533 RepID=UPI0015B2442A|nr:uncharacterized protein LOC118188024 isoform X2 [Stegodyphus dumicola]
MRSKLYLFYIIICFSSNHFRTVSPNVIQRKMPLATASSVMTMDDADLEWKKEDLRVTPNETATSLDPSLIHGSSEIEIKYDGTNKNADSELRPFGTYIMNKTQLAVPSRESKAYHRNIKKSNSFKSPKFTLTSLDKTKRETNRGKLRNEENSDYDGNDNKTEIYYKKKYPSEYRMTDEPFSKIDDSANVNRWNNKTQKKSDSKIHISFTDKNHQNIREIEITDSPFTSKGSIGLAGFKIPESALEKITSEYADENTTHLDEIRLQKNNKDRIIIRNITEVSAEENQNYDYSTFDSPRQKMGKAFINNTVIQGYLFHDDGRRRSKTDTKMNIEKLGRKLLEMSKNKHSLKKEEDKSKDEIFMELEKFLKEIVSKNFTKHKSKLKAPEEKLNSIENITSPLSNQNIKTYKKRAENPGVVYIKNTKVYSSNDFNKEEKLLEKTRHLLAVIRKKIYGINANQTVSTHKWNEMQGISIPTESSIFSKMSSQQKNLAKLLIKKLKHFKATTPSWTGTQDIPVRNIVESNLFSKISPELKDVIQILREKTRQFHRLQGNANKILKNKNKASLIEEESIDIDTKNNTLNSRLDKALIQLARIKTIKSNSDNIRPEKSESIAKLEEILENTTNALFESIKALEGYNVHGGEMDISGNRNISSLFIFIRLFGANLLAELRRSSFLIEKFITNNNGTLHANNFLTDVKSQNFLSRFIVGLLTIIFLILVIIISVLFRQRYIKERRQFESNQFSSSFAEDKGNQGPPTAGLNIYNCSGNSANMKGKCVQKQSNNYFRSTKGFVPKAAKR